MCESTYLRVFLGRSSRISWRTPGSFTASPCFTLTVQSRSFRCFTPRRQENAQPSASQENLFGGHSRFIAEASRNEKWADGVGNARRGGEEGTGEEVEDIPEGKGECNMEVVEWSLLSLVWLRTAFSDILASIQVDGSNTYERVQSTPAEYASQ